jgi:hypothetical protein
MKAKLTAIACLALSLLAQPLVAQTRVDLTAVITKDFIDSPTFDQAARALDAQVPMVGFGWEVVMGHVGIGGSYAADFNQDVPSEWWVDWNGQGVYASYHIFGAGSFIDPFVDAGLGCAGRVFIGPEGNPADKLALTIYPFVSAGAALELSGLRLGAKVSYALNQSAVPATTIPGYPLGRFQVSAFAGLSLGGR